MRLNRFVFVILLTISIYAVKLGFPGEEVHIRGDRTGVGVDTTDTPDAIFEVQSTEDGVLIPRLTILQREAIISPPEGLTIYNTDCGLFNYYDGTDWIPFPNLMGMDVGPIAGSTSICEGAAGISYSIPDVTEATSYTWTLPDDASIAGGAGTRSITVDFGSDEGRICVIAHTPCGSQGDCISISVAEAPVGGSVTGGGTIDFGDPTPTLTLSGHTGDIDRWQKRLDGGGWTDIAHTSTVFSETPSAVGTWDYRAVLSSAGCADAYSDYATVIVEATVSGDSVVFEYTGSIQNWTVPSGVSSITIKAWGAEGGSTAGGDGAYIEATVSTSPGTTYDVFAGQVGGCCTDGAGGGGDASYVGSGTTPVVIAGGGGGGRPNSTGDTYYSGGVGNSTTTPTVGERSSTSYGWGSISSGGNGGGAGGGAWGSGGGGGWYSSGVSGSGSSGGAMRCRGSDQYMYVGGAGGGYNGGPGGDMDSGWGICGGGGGGSYYTGTLIEATAGANTGNGRVVITW